MGVSFADSLKASKDKEKEKIVMASTFDAEPNTVLSTVYSTDNENWTPVNDKGYEFYDDYYDDDYSIVDLDKNIILSKSQINITQVTNSQYIPFKIPRYFDGFDLTNTKLEFYFVNRIDGFGVDYPINVYYNDEYICFGWLIDDNVTAIDGVVKFEIRAIGANSKGETYRWKTKSNSNMSVLPSLYGTKMIEPSETWKEDFLSIINGQVVLAQDAAKEAKAAAPAAAERAQAAEDAAAEARATAEQLSDGIADEVQTAVDARIDAVVDERIANALANHYTKDEVDTLFENFDISDQLDEVKQLIENIDGLANFNVEYDGSTMTFYNGETVIKSIAINSDPSDEWINAYTVTVDEKVGAVQSDLDSFKQEISDNHYKKTETYNADEIDDKLANVSVDLTGYATEKYVDDKGSAISSSVADNASGIASLNKAVADINQTLEGIDKSARVTYDATYGDIELEDGTVAEDMFTLWKTENGVREVQDRFQIQGGGGGTGSSVTLRIAYVDGYTTPIVATVEDSAIIRYNFTGEDSAGDTNLDGTASWKVGNRVVATQEVSTGEREFDLTDYVTVGDNKVVLTITHATGAIATKAWTVKIVDVRLESKFDDTKTNPANSPVVFSFTPYGGVAKTVHFLLDGVEIGTKSSSAAAAGLSDSFSIPAHEHGSHLFEVYMTADINDKTVESNHIIKDIIWYDASVGTPVIGCTQQEITIRQYEAVNIVYAVFDPSTETPSVTLSAEYENELQETVNEYSANIVMSSNTETWQFKTNVLVNTFSRLHAAMSLRH